jgi:pfkB family carbohydrate kinase
LVKLLESKLFNSNQKALVGFDGFIDLLFKIRNGEKGYFNEIKAFGEYIVAKEANSFSLEIDNITKKIGGNAPIFANALAHLGVETDLVASLGFTEINPVFNEISTNCTKYSFAEPGIAYAYEFANAKMMLAQNGSLNEVNWGKLNTTIGHELFLKLFDENDLFCLLNWSEIAGMTSILEGILTDILPKIPKEKKKKAFFDLADCSTRSKTDILNVLQIIEKFSSFAEVTLSLNNNETQTIYKTLFEKEEKNFERMGQKISEKLTINRLILHNSKETLAFNENEITKCSTFFVETPLFSTGAGDHFNAGFCAALLAEFTTFEALKVGNAVAFLYITKAKSPNTNEVFDYLEKHPNANTNI